ncbi:MFS transporter [Fictibacillus sp. KIGAM418]|uniref:MFS transporter n=1 Tax=Fictibacillus marinisediminis TaxID=2878389 RepID=A0A9X2BH48_9BACL|nr:MFS transporter [Fictibacillus marinisediminis]MCK6257203.1 MFS transporter [Fictibacillus marinisediminis]
MRFKDFHPNIKIRIVESLLSGSIGAMIYPFMAIYLAERVGESLTGILLIINIAVGFLVGFYGGYYADTIGRKKIMAIAETLRFASVLIMAGANGPWVHSEMAAAYITIAMMMVNSICWGLAGPAASAMLIDVSTPENRKFMYGITYWTNNLSIALGGLAGGYLFKDYLFELLVGLSIVSMVSVILVVFFIKETYVPVKKTVKKSVLADILSSYRIVFKDTTFILFIVAYLLVLSLEFHLSNYVSVRLSQDMPVQKLFNFSVDGFNMLGILRTENTLLVVLLAVLVSKITSRFKDKRVFFLGLALYIVGYLTISYSNHGLILLTVMVIATVGELMFVPIEQSYLADIPPDDLRSSYMAVSGMVYRGAMTIAAVSITLGHFIPRMGMTLIFMLMACTGIAIFVKVLPSLEEKRTKQKQTA